MVVVATGAPHFMSISVRVLSALTIEPLHVLFMLSCGIETTMVVVDWAITEPTRGSM